jgi:putative membrane protein
MQQRAVRAHREGLITGDQLIILDTELVQFMEICGACERIKNTPIPYSYSSFIKKFIVVYVFTLPFGFAFSLGYYRHTGGDVHLLRAGQLGTDRRGDRGPLRR